MFAYLVPVADHQTPHLFRGPHVLRTTSKHCSAVDQIVATEYSPRLDHGVTRYVAAVANGNT